MLLGYDRGRGRCGPNSHTDEDIDIGLTLAPDCEYAANSKYKRNLQLIKAKYD